MGCDVIRRKGNIYNMVALPYAFAFSGFAQTLPGLTILPVFVLVHTWVL